MLSALVLILSLRPPAIGEPQGVWPVVSVIVLLCENC